MKDIFDSLGIGPSMWSYKEMGFSLVDSNGIIISEELIHAASYK